MSKVMDLEDFIPETYTLRVALNGHKYEFEYGEATVDEVLKLLLKGEEDNAVDKTRSVVVEFLTAHIKEGDSEQLGKDLKDVPYKSTRNGTDIMTLYAAIQQRFEGKKNDGEKVKAKA